jgi:hypothetical protein
MIGSVTLGPGYSLGEDYTCPWQLALTDQNLILVSTDRLDSFLRLGTHSSSAAPLFWSPDGHSLWTTDSRPVGVVRFLVDRSPMLLETQRIPISPWEVGMAQIGEACEDLEGRGLYCLVGSDVGPERLIWHVSRDGKSVTRMVPNMMFNVPTMFCQWCRFSFAITPNSRQPGSVQVVCIGSGLCKETQLLRETVQLLSLSPCGRFFLFSARNLSGVWSLQRFDLCNRTVLHLAETSYGTWSPDGQRIAAVNASQELVLIDRNGSHAHRVVAVKPHTAFNELSYLPVERPQWSSDGRWLVFSLRRWGLESIQPIASLAAAPAAPGSRMMIVDLITFVLNLDQKKLLILPVPSQQWSWRPRMPQGEEVGTRMIPVAGRTSPCPGPP